MSGLPAASPLVGRASAVVRTPMYFGPSARALFGWYHAPPGRAGPRMAVVICPPLGHEYTNAHRSLRHLADRLALAGAAALRFDYHGTGDSTGRDDDPNRVAAWIDSVHDAVRALRETSGCERVGLAGLRMGGTLAAAAACDLDVACLVLWIACERGRTFLRELRALTLASNVEPSQDAGDLEAGGLFVSRDVQQDIARLDLSAMVPRAHRVLVAARDDLPEHFRIRDAWRAAGVNVEGRAVSGYSEMIVAPHNTVIPHAAIDSIVQWIVEGDRADDRFGRPRPAPSLGIAADTLPLGDIQESVVCLGGRHQCFGVLSEPVTLVNPTAPVIVISNAGSVHHVGPNRLHVDLARTLSRAGFRSVRIDLPGLGDSVVDDPAHENVPYPPDASAVIGMALDALARRTGVESFVLMGLCSGAHTAFHAAVDLDAPSIVESVVVNPLTYAYVNGMPLDAPSDAHVARWQRYRRSMGSLRGWAKLFRRDIALTTIVADVFRRASVGLRHAFVAVRAWSAGERRAATPSTLADQLTRLAGRHCTLTLVFSRFDPGHDLLMLEAHRVVKALRRKGQITIRIIDGANHTFDTRSPRRELIAAITTGLVSRYMSR